MFVEIGIFHADVTFEFAYFLTNPNLRYSCIGNYFSECSFAVPLQVSGFSIFSAAQIFIYEIAF